MLRFVVVCTALLAAATAWGQPAAQAPPLVPERALIKQYCSGCHNDSLKSGGMSLTRLNLAHPAESAELAEKVIRRLRTGLMPPPGLPRPAPAAVNGLVRTL